MGKFAMLCATVGLLWPALLAAPADAASSRTFVSGTGTDSGACTRAAPCASFNFALMQTSPGGEINCRDGGDFGLVSITFAVTIS